MLSVHYISDLHPTGYGVAGRGYIRALREAGARIQWTPMVPGRDWGEYLQPLRGPLPPGDPLAPLYGQPPVEADATLVHLIPRFFGPWRRRLPGQKIIGVTVWESDDVPGWVSRELPHVDGLIVPCQWNAACLRRAGFPTPIAVAPHVPTFQGDPLEPAPPIPGARPGDYLFYTIGEWRDRKGLPLTVEAFCRAFTSRDPVCLAVKTGIVNECRRRPGAWWWHVTRRLETSRKDIARILARHADPPRVAVITKSLSSGAMHALHQRADCYVSLTRAEGWALGAYEAAFEGKPVIMTGYGGPLDFLPPDLSYHVRHRLIQADPRGEGDQIFRGALWADPDLDHGVELMRGVFRDPDAARSLGQRLQAHVTAAFEPAAIGRGMLEFIRRVPSR